MKKIVCGICEFLMDYYLYFSAVVLSVLAAVSDDIVILAFAFFFCFCQIALSVTSFASDVRELSRKFSGKEPDKNKNENKGVNEK